MFDISPTIALAVFVSAFVLDYLYARYTYYIISMKAEMAATLAFVWHMLSASVIVQYAENSSYILFHVLRRVLGNLSDRLAAAAGGKGCGFAGAGRRGKGHMVLIGASIDALIDRATSGAARKRSAHPTARRGRPRRRRRISASGRPAECRRTETAVGWYSGRRPRSSQAGDRKLRPSAVSAPPADRAAALPPERGSHKGGPDTK